MAPSADQDPPDPERLVPLLHALASPTRLQLLWALRVPRRPSELRVPAAGARAGLRSERTLSRPAIIEHLGVLGERGLVRRLADGRFVVDQPRMFALVGDLGRLARIRSTVELDVEETLAGRAGSGPAPPPPGAKLVLVGGPYEGRSYGLGGPGPWTLGRGASSAVRLEYDPHVSRVHALVRRTADGAYTLEAATSTNPVLLNFRPVASGVTAPLLAGAVLSMGASRLVFQPV